MALFETIDSFSGEYRFLSNFYQSPFIDTDDRYWPTVEHYYQAHKTTSLKDFEYIAKCNTPGQAKRAARKVQIRSDWDCIKTHIMYQALVLKFDQNPDLAQKLIDTGDVELIEGNIWGDTFWGFDKKLNKGKNILGCQLMILRDILKKTITTKC